MQKPTQKLRVLLVQLPHPSYPDRNVPLAAGYLKAAAFQQNLLSDVDVEILDPAYADYAGCQMLTDIIIAKKPTAIGFSLYLWNIERSLNIINRIKAALPQVTIIVGGPEVTKESKLLTSNPNIDIAVFGEGEKTFTELLKYFISGTPKLDDIAGLGFREKPVFHFNAPRPRILDINTVPSPYLLGYLDPKKHRELLLFTMKGCMLGCSYCSWTARGKLTTFNLQRLEEELLLARNAGGQLTVSIIDSALNASPIFVDFCKMLERINKDGLLRFNCFVQADLIDETSAKLLKRSGIKSIEVGLQTADSSVLSKINRRMDLEKFLSGVQALKKEGITPIVDVIVGLPGDSPSTFDKTMMFATENELNPLIFQLSINKGAVIYRQRKDFGAKIQSYPPYYIKQTKTFSKKQLQENFARYRDKYSDLDRITNLNYPAIMASSLDVTDRWADPLSSLHEIDFPISSIVFDGCPDIELMNRLAIAISNKVSNNLTILYTCNEDACTESLEIMLTQIFRRNEHINCILLIENSNPQKVRVRIEKYLSSLKLSKTFLDHRDEIVSKYLPSTHRRSMNIYELQEVAVPNKGKSHKAKYFLKKLTLNRDTDEQLLKKELSDSSNCGFLVDFYGLEIDSTKNYLNLISSSGKDAFFKDWAIQRLWEHEYLKISAIRQPMHYELLFGKNSQVFGKCYSENDLIWDSISKWKLVRKEYAGLDLEKIIIEKVSRIINSPQGTQQS